MKVLNAREEAVLKLLREGMKMSAIGAKLGLTRNAVAGIKFRMKDLVPVARPRKVFIAAKAARPRPAAARGAPNGSVDLLGLHRASCRYPVAEAPWQFCGCHAEAPPYCAAHRKLCYSASYTPA